MGMSPRVLNKARRVAGMAGAPLGIPREFLPPGRAVPPRSRYGNGDNANARVPAPVPYDMVFGDPRVTAAFSYRSDEQDTGPEEKPRFVKPGSGAVYL